MNLLLVKIGTEPGLEAIVSKLKAFEPRVRTFGVTNMPNQTNYFDVEVTSTYEALLGAHDEYLTHGLYVRPDLFRKIAKYEGQIMRMLERVAIHDLETVKKPPLPIPKFMDSVDDRSQLFLRMVAYWDDVFDRNKIRAVVAQNYGHNGWDAVIQIVAEARSIPYLYFHEVRPFLGALYVHEKSSDIGERQLGNHLIQAADLYYRVRDDTDLRRTRMLSQVGLCQLNEMTVEAGVKSSQLNKIFSRLSNPRKFSKRVLKSLKRRHRNRASIKDEVNAISNSHLPTNFVFCEVQSQPNATTTVKAWMYADQRELLAQVSNNLPEGWSLVVKESDRQWSRMYPRRRNYWSQIAAIPKVMVIPHGSNAVEVMKLSRALIETSYSTLALESVIHGVPVLVFGASHIGDLPNVYPVETDQEIVEALAGINVLNRKITSEEIRDGLARFVDVSMKSTIPGSLSSVPFFTDDDARALYLEETTSKVAAVIAAWINGLPELS